MNFIYEKERITLNNESDEKIAEITWQDKGLIWLVDHTYTHPAYRGQGLALKLVDEVVRLAHEQGVKIMPICPYVIRQFDDHQHYFEIDARRNQEFKS